MWAEPRLLNSAASALYALALFLALYAAGFMLAHSPAFPLRAIRVHGDLEKVKRGQIVDALQGRVSGTFFTCDIEAVRSMFQTIPWVRRAQVRRYWPDRLEVTLEEHVALARWGQGAEGRVVNTRGELFTGRLDEERAAHLPLFVGPEGSEQEIARSYAHFLELLAPISLRLRSISLSPRRSWSIVLTNGLTVQLGHDGEKDPVRLRLARFVEVYPRTLARSSGRLKYVDLRYPNGFALRIPDIQGTQSRNSTQRES